MSYSLFFEKNVIKYLSKLEYKISKRLINKIKELKDNPFPKETKRIVNSKEKIFRIRIGDYRVLYRLELNKIIIVFLIDKRSKVYKK